MLPDALKLLTSSNTNSVDIQEREVREKKLEVRSADYDFRPAKRQRRNISNLEAKKINNEMA